MKRPIQPATSQERTRLAQTEYQEALRLIKQKLPRRSPVPTGARKDGGASQPRSARVLSAERPPLPEPARGDGTIANKIVALKRNLAQLQKLVAVKAKARARPPIDKSAQKNALSASKTRDTIGVASLSRISAQSRVSELNTRAASYEVKAPNASTSKSPRPARLSQLSSRQATEPTVERAAKRLICPERLPPRIAGQTRSRVAARRGDSAVRGTLRAESETRAVGIGGRLSRGKTGAQGSKTVEKTVGRQSAAFRGCAQPALAHETYVQQLAGEGGALGSLDETAYQPDPHYLEHCQPHLKWEMRAILLDWLQEVAANFFFKRETFFYAANYLDRYLSVVPRVERSDLQLVGVSALFLAAKMEEVYTPKLASMVAVTDNSYSPEAVRDCELRMYHALEMRITPPTLAMWAQLFATEWDRFVHAHGAAFRVALPQLPRALFKEPNEHSYALFRELMQLLDVAVLDPQSLQYKPRALVCAVQYIVLGKRLQQFKREDIEREFAESSLYLLDQDLPFNCAFSDFMQKVLGLSLPDLLPTVQYIAVFVAVALDCAFPLAAAADPQNVLQGHYEDFLAYQTHSAANLPFVLNRRGRQSN